MDSNTQMQTAGMFLGVAPRRSLFIEAANGGFIITEHNVASTKHIAPSVDALLGILRGILDAPEFVTPGPPQSASPKNWRNEPINTGD